MSDPSQPIGDILGAAAHLASAQQSLITHLQEQLSAARAESARAAARCAELERENRDLVYDLLMQQERDGVERPPEYADMVAMRRQVAQRLRDSGVSLRTIGGAFGVSEKSIRNWTTDREQIKEAA